jgi:hypothetical protein
MLAYDENESSRMRILPPVPVITTNSFNNYNLSDERGTCAEKAFSKASIKRGKSSNITLLSINHVFAFKHQFGPQNLRNSLMFLFIIEVDWRFY